MDLQKNSRTNIVVLCSAVVSILLHVVLAYFTARSNTSLLLSCWVILFAAYFLILSTNVDTRILKRLVITAVVARLVYLFALPALSDDYFRFVWDGQLWASGINPFRYLPSELIDKTDFTASSTAVFNGLNSPEYYSVYPPVMQYIFRLAVTLSGGSVVGAVVIMRLSIILSEIGSLILINKLLRKWQMDRRCILLYALNPLVITELSGNLHFEAVMIFFLLLSVCLLTIQKLIFAGVAFALSVCAKLIPLMLLPFLIKRLGLKQFIIYSLVVFVTSIGLFVPLADKELFINISKSINLYFQSFEFNASVFYVVRELGFWVKGYDVIQVAGSILPIVFLLFVGVLFLRENEVSISSFFRVSLMVLFSYYALALVVHPWYISTLILCSVFTRYRFALVWSALLGCTYITYQSVPYVENLWVVTIEYVVVYLFFWYELTRKKPFRTIFNTVS